MKSIFATLFTTACVLSQAHASSQSTAALAEQELGMIKTLTDNLTTTISGWNGTDVSVALSINTASSDLVAYIQNATTQLQAVVTTFNTDESFQIGAPTQNLAYSVNASIAALIKQKPNFVAQSFGSIVITSLNSQLNASNHFSSVLLGMIPTDIKPVADALNTQITASLNQGIDCFNNKNESCTTAVEDPSRTYDAAVDSGAIKATSAASRTMNVAGFAALSMAIVAAVFAL